MDLKTQAGMGLRLLKQYGVRDFYYRFLEWCGFQSRNRRYRQNRSSYFPGGSELERQRRRQWKYAPLISIVVPAYETPENFLRQLIDSVLSQTYGNLELCLADGSVSDCVEKVASSYKDSRISYKRLKKNAGISENTNEGFAMAEGEYLALLDHDDLITENALYEMVKVLNEEEKRPDVIYSDEDKMVGDSTDYCEPYFKSDYNEELLRRNNYICHFLFFSRKILEKAGGLDGAYDGAQDHEFLLRCKRNGAVFYHVPKVLYHWRIHPASTSGNPMSKLYAYENGKKAVQDYLKSQNVAAEVGLTKDLGFYRVKYLRNKKMRVSILAENAAQMEDLKARTVISKYTDITWQYAGEHGNDEIKKLNADYILLACGGLMPQEEDWLERLLGYAQEKRVGAVSGAFVNSRQKILQNGMMVSREGNVYPLFEGLPVTFQGYFRRAETPGNVSTLALDFVLLSRKAWHLAGKFDETLSFPARDVDFFARMRGCGYEAVCAPEVRILCGKSHPWDYAIEAGEFQRLRERWESQWEQGDMAYNRNLCGKNGRFTFIK